MRETRTASTSARLGRQTETIATVRDGRGRGHDTRDQGGASTRAAARERRRGTGRPCARTREGGALAVRAPEEAATLPLSRPRTFVLPPRPRRSVPRLRRGAEEMEVGTLEHDTDSVLREPLRVGAVEVAGPATPAGPRATVARASTPIHRTTASVAAVRRSSRGPRRRARAGHRVRRP